MRQWREQSSAGWRTLTYAVALWLLWMTLRSNPTIAVDLAPLTKPAATRGISACVLINLMSNIVVFAPLGATLAFALDDKPTYCRLLLATLTGAVLSLCIELAQTTISTRVSELNDRLLNTVGTAAGALIGYRISDLTSWRIHLNDRPDH